MSTASFAHLAFVALVAALHGAAPRPLRRYLLLAASLVFYGSFDWAFVFLLLGVIAASFLAGLAIDRWREARWQRPLWILLVLAPLLFYKYVLVWWQDLVAAGVPVSGLDFGKWGAVLVPVGLSFFTFQCLGYVLDVARRTSAPERDPIDYALFVAFFPQLLAGPIERFGRLAPQLKAAARPSPDMVLDGLLMIAFGLFLKTCLGDRLAVYVDAVFAAPERNASATALLGLYGFTLQLYGDFFGYSMLALGSARLFGIALSPNFEQPFLARDIAEFWQRWHITLTRWIGDYVYRPLAIWCVSHTSWPRGAQEALTLLVTWVAMGLWHGAGMNFVLFGAMMAAFMFAHNRWARAKGKPRGRGPWWRAALAMLVTFHVVVASFALIRVGSVEQYLALLGAIAAGTPGLMTSFDVMAYAALAIAVAAGVDLTARFAPGFETWRRAWARVLLIGILLILVVLTGSDQGRAFIYFRF